MGNTAFNRDDMLAELRQRQRPWDLLIIGGGATGLGTAVDAAARGYEVALIEQADFAKGTSSRSTKLIHGGVRYLRQGRIGLVKESLLERARLLRNAPHIVHKQPFIVPAYGMFDRAFYGTGLRIYDQLAGRAGLGPSTRLSAKQVLEVLPHLRRQGLRGGIGYYDAQFDDARLALNLAQTAAVHGAVVVNYLRAAKFNYEHSGRICGVLAIDEETNDELCIDAKCVVNAGGPFVDAIRQLHDAHAESYVSHSQGIHLIFPGSLLQSRAALLVPKTIDKRVLFAIPFQGITILGTTDTPVNRVVRDPCPTESEIELVLESANQYLSAPASRSQIINMYAGLRPLVRPTTHQSTANISREHAIWVDSKTQLLTVAGGKWTTYRKMAEDVVDQAARVAQLRTAPCVTAELPIYSAAEGASSMYGAEAQAVQALRRALGEADQQLHAELSLHKSDVIWACRQEMARTVDDVLSRRHRTVLHNVSAARSIASDVLAIMAQELGRDSLWVDNQLTEFQELHKNSV